MRDPYRYAEQMLIVPLPLVPLLALFNGTTTEADAKASLVRITGDIGMCGVFAELRETLSGSGFLEDAVFESLRADRHRAFAQSAKRAPAHAGAAYPADEAGLRETLAGYLDGGSPGARREGLIGIAAPHVSPEGGWRCYQAAYGALGPEHADRTFVVLGTSHYGEPETFGLTRKPFVTPLGETSVDQGLVDALAEGGGQGVLLEDYCHAVEHSIEFQVVFLQGLYGAGVRIVPVLCGPFLRSTQSAGRPEEDTRVARFLEALHGIHEREGSRLLWVLGVDMAHVGRRYGDERPARAEQGDMIEVGRADRLRCEKITRGDAESFWALVQENADALRWCGASPFYAFLRSVRPPSGEVLRYEQWNIDDESVVTFAGMAFYETSQTAMADKVEEPRTEETERGAR